MAASKAKRTKSKGATSRIEEGKVLRSVSKPKQARSEETLERLLDAAESLIKAKGLANVSIAALAREAGSSVGGFYARFKDKDELLRALHEREQRRVQASVASLSDPKAWAEQPLATLIERALQMVFARLEGRQKLAAAFLESAARKPAQWRHAVEFRRMVVDAFVALLSIRADEIDHPDPEKATRFAIQQVLAVVDQRALFAHMDGPESGDLSDAELRDELTRSLCRYLGVTPQPFN